MIHDEDDQDVETDNENLKYGVGELRKELLSAVSAFTKAADPIDQVSNLERNILKVTL